jgi:hypothetical protein
MKGVRLIWLAFLHAAARAAWRWSFFIQRVVLKYEVDAIRRKIWPER